MVRTTVGVDSRRDDADRLALEHRKRRRPEVEHDVVRVVVAATSVTRRLPATVAVMNFSGAFGP